jgi:DNA modification methylase
LLGIPWRVAFALQADGWYLRQDIIWSKPNPMPESVRDRCTKSHEYIFLLSKSERYFFDRDAIAEPFANSSIERLRQDVSSQSGSDRVPGKTNGPMKAVGWNANRASYKPGSASNMNDGEHVAKSDEGLPLNLAGRNKRSVWTVTTQPFGGAHFAVFPTELIEPCILAGSSTGDVVMDPFMGSGTTAQVAEHLGRQWIGCELNPEYMPLQRQRLQQRALTL